MLVYCVLCSCVDRDNVGILCAVCVCCAAVWIVIMLVYCVLCVYCAAVCIVIILVYCVLCSCMYRDNVGILCAVQLCGS